MPSDRSPKQPTPLSPQQLQAIEHLILGRTLTDTAAAVNVDRKTLYRWRKHDFQFAAEFNRRYNDLTASLDVRLRRLAADALPTVEDAIRAGNLHAALTVLRGVGALSGARSTPLCEDPDRLEDKHTATQALLSTIGRLT